ncbi:MAG: hypothetical protein K6F88_06030 [Ruminococcus sp.]|nr:hypothetical protein [Ruminococcus sp.]
MKKHILIPTACVFAVFTTFFSTTANAISFYIDPQTFSYTKVLPVIVGASLVFEAAIIMLLSKVRRIVNVSFAVFLANGASFVILRFLIGFFNKQFFYSGMLLSGTKPAYWLFYLMCFAVTLAIELPIIWLSLRPFTQKKLRLLLSAAAANLFTFTATAVFELYILNLLKL